ncbi:unnamed protein product, partial [Owenia fusiformis]
MYLSNIFTLRHIKKSFNILAIIALIMTIGCRVWQTWIFQSVDQLHNASVCKPKMNIVFVKIPKCASSTVTNIFQRYGEKHHLKFLLPENNYFLGGYPEPFTILPEYRGHQYNMMVNHVIFNAKPIQDLMPNDTVYIGVVRHPVSHLKSIYNFFHLWESGLPALDQFEENPLLYYRKANTYLTKMRIRNFQSYHYKLQTTAKLNATEVERFVHIIDGQFDFVIVADHLKESLLLLKDYLCWSMEDILFVSHKVRDYDHPNGEHNQDLEMVERNIRNWSSADFALFEHFNETLWSKIASKDSNVFQDELTEYSKQLEIVNKACLKYDLSAFSYGNGTFSNEDNSHKDEVLSKRETFSKRDFSDKNGVNPKRDTFSERDTKNDSEFSQCAKMYLKPPLYVMRLK